MPPPAPAFVVPPAALRVQTPPSRPLGRYRLLAPLARGAMGALFIADRPGGAHGDTGSGIFVLKTIGERLGHDPRFLSRFLTIGRAVRALAHPHLARVLSAGVEGGVACAALEFVAGEDLARLTAAARHAGAPLPVGFALECGAAVLSAVAAVHDAVDARGASLGLVHGDVSRTNVRVQWDGTVRLLDVGLARTAARHAGCDDGSARGEGDVRAAARLVWELLAGVEPPRDGFAPLVGRRRDVPPALDALLASMRDGARGTDAARAGDAAAEARHALVALAVAHGIELGPAVTRRVVRALMLEEREAADREPSRPDIRVRGAARPPTVPPDARGVVAAVAPRGEAPPAGLLAGTRYRLVARIGAGGSGEVYEAEQVDLGRRVALKLLFAEHCRDAAAVARFRLEARAVAALEHPHIVPVWDFNATADGRWFYAMPRLEGETLRERLAREGRLAPRDALRIGAAVARGLAAAHAVGVVHRDVKPENIFLEHGGGVRLLDFGVAKALSSSVLASLSRGVTREGEVCGSPAYMAPERGRGGAVDGRSDVYATGAVLYEALAGARIFDDGTFLETLARHMSVPPPTFAARAPGCDVPPAVEALVRWCLEKDPARRPQSALALAAHLAAACDALTPRAPAAPARPPPHAAPAPAPVGRAARALLLVAVLVAVATALLVAWTRAARALPAVAPRASPLHSAPAP